jgi:conjugative relaxase-like TrwC/TraI family protein
MQQIDYRLSADSGCSLDAGDDSQVGYRLDSDRPLEWVGEGLRLVGITPGGTLDDAGVAAARLLADGRDPRTGDVLVAPKLAVHPDAKLDAGPFVDAVRAAAAAAGTTPAALLGGRRLVARFERLQRGLARSEARSAGDGPAVVVHRAPVADLQALADAAGVDLADVYPQDELEHARRFADVRVNVGNRGYDLTLDLPKSYSVLMGLAPTELAVALEDVYLNAVRETVGVMQGWAGYAMRGHHGDGQQAQRVDGDGLLGWMTVHRTARPVPGAAPDPHLHAHVTLLNLVHSVAGGKSQWSTVGAGGRDFHRHAHAADAYLKARLRQVTRQRWGIGWERDDRTGAWEITEVPAELRAVFSKRAGQVGEQLLADGINPGKASVEQAKTASAKSKQAKLAPDRRVDLRGEWRRQAETAGVDVDALVAAAMPGPGRPAPEPLPVADVAEHVFRPEDGLTAHRKVTTRADVLAQVIDAQPGGITDLAEAEHLVDAVLAEPVVVPLPAAGATHLSNSGRYTSADVVEAERTVLAAAELRYGSGTAVLPADTVARAVGVYEAGAGHQLSAEQRAVIERLATAGHGVDTVVGVAGAGKTTIMAALRAGYEANGMTVRGAATAAVAADNLRTGAGVTSHTIASWLARIAEGRGLDGVDVLVIDEASMVDDRHLAALNMEAMRTGTKLVAIGDPLQMKAVGVGGTFAAVHELVDGLQLSENRRQRDVQEREALATWRDDQRRAALDRWSASGRVHVTGTPEQAHTVMAQQWAELRRQWPDPHDQIEQLLMLAHTNADVDRLNHAARQVRAAAGELGAAHLWHPADGGAVTLAIGDVVMTRNNDRQAGVLNGHRGVITAVDEQGRLQVERREHGPDGPALVRVWLSAGYVEAGGVVPAYAITAAKAQGLTADRTLVYGNGMDAHVLYPAMSRDRDRVDLWLALHPLETDADRARHGTPRTEGEARARAVGAYAAALENDLPDRLVLTELGQAPQPVTPAGRVLARVRQVAADTRRTVDEITALDDARPAPAAVADVDALAARVAALPDEQMLRLSARDELRERLQRARLTPAQRQATDDHARRAVMRELQQIAAGGPPSGRHSRAQLDDALAIVRAETATQAARHRAAAAQAAREVATQTARDRDATRRAVLAEPTGTSTDREAGWAARLAAQAFPAPRRPAADDGREQLTPDGATGGHVPWQSRPYGAVPTARLAERVEQTEREAAVRAARARQWQQQADQLDQLIRAGAGPAQQALQEQRAHLQARAEAAARAEQEHSAAQAVREQARQVWQQAAQLREQARRNPIMLRLSGTSRRELTEQAGQHQQHGRALDAQADRHAQAARHAAEQAAGPDRSRPVVGDLAALTRDWEQRLAGAVGRDYATLRRYRDHAATDQRAAETAGRTVTGLRAETGYRANLDPVLARSEQTSREHAARQAAAAQTAQARTAQADHDYYRDHHPHPDHGPDLGL